MPCNNCGNLDATRDKISLGADNQLCRCHQNNTPSNFIEKRIKALGELCDKLQADFIGTGYAAYDELEVFFRESLELQRQKFVEGIETEANKLPDSVNPYKSGMRKVIEIINSL